MKEAAVILKTAIIEHPFQPELTMNSEPVRGLGTDGFPILRVMSEVPPNRGRKFLWFPIKGPHPGTLAVWSRADRCLYLRCHRQMGARLGKLAAIPSLLEPAYKVELAAYGSE